MPPPLGLWPSLRLAFARSVRFKLLTLVLAPLLLGVPVLLLIVWLWGSHGYDQMLISKVGSDLGTARQYFDRVQNDILRVVEGFASSHRLVRAMEQENAELIREALSDAAEREGLDYLLLLDTQGQVRTGTGIPLRHDRAAWKTVREALRGRPMYGLEVFSAARLAALNPMLPDRARIDLLPTRNARPDDRTAEDRGLMIQVAAPILGAQGEVLGVVEGGILLNRNLDIVDHLNAVVYQAASLPTGSQGTATLFLGDVRIATNVRLLGDRRALGTRASQVVSDKVLGHGGTWLGSAFVVNSSYISGYEPLTDTSGQRVGMLYVGFLEAPLQASLYWGLAWLFLAFVMVSVLGTLADLRWARAIFRPLEKMDAIIARVASGDDSARLGPTARQDELGHLSRAFDHLLDDLAARQTELQRWNQALDQKVAERTAELEQANATLKRAQQHLVMTEKLTAIGELTAGVAHEINNPVAVIQGNLDLLRDVLGPDAEPVQEELRLIDQQTQRIHAIVTKLLRFARPGDYAGHAEDVTVNSVITDCLVLTRHNLNRAQVRVETRLEATGCVEINRGEVLQVVINLLVNALHAMAEGGVLTLETADLQRSPADPDSFDGAVIRVRDTGSGIAPADLDRIFDPFFTTKKQAGTGLGLSISYAILQRYGGRITVDSTPGEQTTFTLWLRRQAEYSDCPSAPLFAARFEGE